MIDSRVLGVSHRQIARDEVLQYNLVGAVGERQTDPKLKPVRARLLRADIDAVRAKIRRLNELAEAGKPRDNVGVEPEAERLSEHVLPPGGFLRLLGEKSHPHFSSFMDAASEIPWEMLQERNLVCPNRHRTPVPDDPDGAFGFICRQDDSRMVEVRRKLVEDYHLTHLVYGDGRVSVDGRQFLLVIDPRGDLLSKEKDPDGFCEQHWADLREILTQRGYEVIVRRQDQATVRAVLDLVASPEVAGVYYFGHGNFSIERGEGYLLLADDDLPAAEIEEAGPQARFVFLNACWASQAGGDFDFTDRRSRGVAQAFAKGVGKVVIAPVVPLVNVHAAGSALHFFRQALDQPMGEALKSAREISLRAYLDENLPHISWLAYRYFGDPNASLFPASSRLTSRSEEANTSLSPVAESCVPAQVTGVLTTASRIFDTVGQLNPGTFAFSVTDVLQSAAARRNQQKRTRLTPMDFLVGLIRKGDLTRFVFRQEGIDDLDALCTALEQRSEIEPRALRKELQDEWAITGRDDFRDELTTILEKADKVAAEPPRISEQGVLEAFAEGGSWAVENDFGLPPAAGVLRRLRLREQAGVDDNGLVSLRGLDTAARNVIESAHALAQQRGMPDIPNRLIMAALVADEKGFGARVCRCAGVDPELLCFVMVALAEGDESGGQPRTFGLSPEVCRRIVTPILDKARKLAGKDVVGERHLFRAFCDVASPAFKELVSTLSGEGEIEGVELGKVDLDDLSQIDLEFWEHELNRLDEDAKRVIRAAHSLSQDCGAFPVPNRLLMAGFLHNPEGLVPSLLKRRKISAETLKAQLIAASDSGSQRRFSLNEEACGRAVRPVLNKAAGLAEGQPVTESQLFQAFCSVAPPELKQALRAPIFGVDLEILASQALHAPSLDEGTNPESAAKPSADSGGPPVNWDPHPFRAEQFDDGAWHALGQAARLAGQQGWSEIRSPHLLAALFGTTASAVGSMMTSLRASAADLQKMALAMLPPPPKSDATELVRFGAHTRQLISYTLQMAGQQGHTKVTVDDLLVVIFAEQDGPIANLVRAVGGGIAFAGADRGAQFPTGPRRSALATFGVDLTEKARQGQLPEIVGRDEEINTALRTLLLLENANPLLVGEAGVGKTAIVEGIAQRIVRGPCPKKLQSMRVIELSAGSLLANTRLRGEFEQRIQEVLAEARDGIILFIDEIHTIMGAGSAEGSGPDAGNMLKTALARGEIRLIGATTHAEFKRTIARDKALSRRFQGQTIGPPSRDATLLVLSARQSALEKHHEVKISEESRVAAVDLSGRYIVDKQWPAKARDVLERACVLAVTEGEAPHGGVSVEVTAEHVAKVVSQWTGVPLERLSATDAQSLAMLEQRLGAHIVGQQEAIRVVAEAIRRGRQGIAGRNRPWGVFLFVGPPGVGKTELAKVIGDEVFGGAEGLIRFDMGDFSEPHSSAKLIGAPPGYVGYQDGAPLVERLRTHPYSLLLFDEIEHAHENVLAVLLRLLSEGTLADQDGNVADGRNSIVVFTSNLLAPGEERRRLGFATDAPSQGQSDLRTLLERKLPRKLIDRMDGIIRFNALTEEDLKELVRREVEDRKVQVKFARAVEVEVAPGVVPWLVGRVCEAGQGARAVRRTVDDHLGGALTAGLSVPPPAVGAGLVVSVGGDGGSLEARWVDGSLSGPRDGQ